MEDDGTNSFLAFLTAAQEDKNAPKAVEKFNDDANLLAQLTNDRGEPKVPPPKSLPRAAPPAPGLIAARPVRRSPKSAHSWQPDQDEVLRKAVAENGGKNWKSIASSVPGKSPTQCLHRWQRVLNPNVVKGPWKHEEDERLRALVDKIGSKHWSRIAQEMLGRNGKQCRERWINHLKPDILKDPWTRAEEEVLLNAYARIGSKWAEMEKILPGRTENAIKNHWHSTLRKSRTIEDYTQSEQNRAIRRKRPATTASTAAAHGGTAAIVQAAKVSSKLQIDVAAERSTAPAPGSDRDDGNSPVFSPARVVSPEPEKAQAEDLITPTNDTHTDLSYTIGDILAVRSGDSFAICRVVDALKRDGLRVSWYESESAGDFANGAAPSKRPRGRDSPVVPGETYAQLGKEGETETIRLDAGLVKLRSSGAGPASTLTLSEEDCTKLGQLCGAGGESSAKRSRT